MKTTIDISNGLFAEARSLADRRGTTFKEIVETALRNFLKGERKTPTKFKLRWHTFRGNGLVEGLSEGDWAEIRRRAYEGRGG